MLRDFGETEIEDLDESAIGDDDVGGLEVAVDDSAGVRDFEGVCDLDGPIEDVGDLELSGFEALLDGAAFDQLHGDEMKIAILPEIVDGTNIGMIECGSCASFALEAVECTWI